MMVLVSNLTVSCHLGGTVAMLGMGLYWLLPFILFTRKSRLTVAAMSSLDGTGLWIGLQAP